MARSTGRTGRTAILAVAIAASLGAATQAGAQEVLAMDPYVQGRCPGENGYQPGFHLNFNPKVNAWPVYEPTECQPRQSEPETRGATSPTAEKPQSPSTGEPQRQRAKTRRARCAQRHARAGWRCARKTRPV